VGEFTIGALIRGWLLLLLVGAGVMVGGGAVLVYTPGPPPFAFLALLGFVVAWGLAVYPVFRRWWPQSLGAAPLVSLDSDVGRTLRLLSLVALFAALFGLASSSLFLYTPGPLSTDILVTLGFSAAVAFGTYHVLRGRGPWVRRQGNDQ